MTRVALIVEGHGDVSAVPELFARTAALFGHAAFALKNPIRAGEAKKLARTGELERYVEMAASREDADEVLIVLDLDDDCAATWGASFEQRASVVAARRGKVARVCFCLREFEGFFLADFGNLSAATPEYGWTKSDAFSNPHGLRDAKGTLARTMASGVYKETRDQVALTKKLNTRALFVASRCYRKFVKSALGLDYAELSARHAAL